MPISLYCKSKIQYNIKKIAILVSRNIQCINYLLIVKLTYIFFTDGIEEIALTYKYQNITTGNNSIMNRQIRVFDGYLYHMRPISYCLPYPQDSILPFEIPSNKNQNFFTHAHFQN